MLGKQVVGTIEVNCWGENSSTNHVVEVRKEEAVTRYSNNWASRENGIDMVYAQGNIEVRDIEFLDIWGHCSVMRTFMPGISIL